VKLEVSALNPEVVVLLGRTPRPSNKASTDRHVSAGCPRAEKEQIFNEGTSLVQPLASATAASRRLAEFVAYGTRCSNEFVPHKTVPYGSGSHQEGIPGPRGIPKPVSGRILSALSTPTPPVVLVGKLPRRCVRCCN